MKLTKLVPAAAFVALAPLALTSPAFASPAPTPAAAADTKTSVTITIGDTKIQITAPGNGKPVITTEGKPAEVTVTPAESAPAATPTPSATPDTQDDEIADQQAAQGAPGDAATIEDEIFAETNAYREANNLPKLERSTCLDGTADKQSKVMLGQLDEKDDIFHADLDGVAKECPAVELGENIAAQQPDAATVMNDWKNSPGHDKNLRGDYTHIGVAVTVEGGKVTHVQQFAKAAA